MMTKRKSHSADKPQSASTDGTVASGAPSPIQPADQAAAVGHDNGSAPATSDDDPGAGLLSENQRLQDQLLRLQADFDNYRKRMQRDRAEWVRTANEALISDLLPVLDHLELALSSSPSEADNPYTEGFRMVRDQLTAVLRQYAVESMEVDGTSFDPNLHEAILHVPSIEVAENRVITQTRRGFLLDGRLLRPAQVVVSSGPPPSEAGPDAGDAAESDAADESASKQEL